MISSGAIWLFWLANLVLGNNGNLVHMIWWRFTQGAAIFPLVGGYIVYWVESSYGVASQVMNSWCGNDSCSGGSAAVWKAATASTWGNAGVPDNKYLLYKNMHPVGTDNLYAVFTTGTVPYYLADSHGNQVFWYVGFSQLVNLVIMLASFHPFKNKYNYEVLMNELAAQSADESNCVDGLDEDGNVCYDEEASDDYEAATEDSTCVDGLDEDGNDC